MGHSDTDELLDISRGLCLGEEDGGENVMDPAAGPCGGENIGGESRERDDSVRRGCWSDVPV